MALKLKINKADWEQLDEGIKGLYEEKGEEFVLSVDGIEDTTGLKTALQKERAEREKYAKLAKSWESTGKTPEEITSLLAEHQTIEADKAMKAGEFEKLKVQLLDSHKKELAKKDEETSKMKTTLERYLVDASATTAIAELKGVPQLLLPHVKNAVRVIENDGEYIVQVVDATGTPRINNKGECLSIKELVEEMRQSEIFGRAFEATGTTGSGSTGAKTNMAPIKNPWKKETFNLTEQGRIFKENPELAQRLKKEASAS